MALPLSYLSFSMCKRGGWVSTMTLVNRNFSISGNIAFLHLSNFASCIHRLKRYEMTKNTLNTATLLSNFISHNRTSIHLRICLSSLLLIQPVGIAGQGMTMAGGCSHWEQWRQAIWDSMVQIYRWQRWGGDAAVRQPWVHIPGLLLPGHVPHLPLWSGDCDPRPTVL